MTKRHRVPVWLMGLTNLSYGIYGGVVAFAVPQILGLRHVPEERIASLTAVAFMPGFFAFLLSPVLDVRFSRRWYSVLLAFLSAITLVVAFLNLNHFALLEVMLTIGFGASYLYQSALSGWISSIISSSDEEKTVSVWSTVANVGGFGIIAVGGNQLVMHLSALTVALLLGVSVVLPTIVFAFMQAPGPDRRLASESFLQFFGDLVKLVKRREVLIAVVIFLAPAATFSLTNFLGSRGDDFHASAGFVGLVGGVCVAVAGVVGCFLMKPLSKLLPLRPFYLSIGVVGSLCTMALILLPHKPMSFAIALIVVNVFQSMAITTSFAITYEVIGRDNPLASTTFCFLTSAYSVPISYMIYVDAFGYARHGIAGAFAADATMGVVASCLLGLMLIGLSKRSKAVTV